MSIFSFKKSSRQDGPLTPSLVPTEPPASFSSLSGENSVVKNAPKVSEPRDIPYSIALFFVALLPRVLVALAWAREPVWDGHYYHLGATRIAEGHGYSEAVVNALGKVVDKPWSHYPVGYSGILSVFYRLFGHSSAVGPLANAFLGALLVVVVHRLGRYAMTNTRARVAGGMAALHPGLIAQSAILMTEAAAALFLLGAAWASISRRTSWVGAAVSGVLLGIGALVRPASLLLLPALFLLGPRPYLAALKRTAIATAFAGLVIAPWTIRNCQVMDGCALISTNGGWNLAIGSITKSGRFQTLRAADGCPVVTGQVQQDRCWGEVGAQKIRENPSGWLALIPKKLSQTYDHESFQAEYLHEAAPALWPENRRAAARELLTVFHWLLVTAAAFSPVALLTSLRRRVSTITQATLLLATAALVSYCFSSPEHPFFTLVLLCSLLAVLPFPGRPTFGPAGRFLHAILLGTTLTHAVFFGEDRYHIVVTPVLCLLAATALRGAFKPAAWAKS